MDFLFKGDDPDEKVDEVFGRDHKFNPADYEDELPGEAVSVRERKLLCSQARNAAKDNFFFGKSEKVEVENYS